MQKKRGVFYAVDLFCGGGGLSQGLKDAGFKVVAGVELDADAGVTYNANHPAAKLIDQDIRTVSGSQLLGASPSGKIDLIAACPPCQGFSSLTTKYKREDARNSLIYEFVRLTEEIRPRAIMMENVPGLALGRGKAMFEDAVKKFQSMGYEIDYKVCDVADYGVPQHRRRLVMLGFLGKKVYVATKTHGKGKGLKPWRTVRETLKDIPEPTIYCPQMALTGSVATSWNVVRKISECNIARLLAIPSEGDRRSLPRNLRPKCHQDSDKGFCNVYGRMKWDEPSPTITGGCTTLSKGRFGHPVAIRTISVYEAAKFQTFPDEYVFSVRSVDAVCKIIGNALPPLFAKVMAMQCMQALRNSDVA